MWGLRLRAGRTGFVRARYFHRIWRGVRRENAHHQVEFCKLKKRNCRIAAEKPLKCQKNCNKGLTNRNPYDIIYALNICTVFRSCYFLPRFENGSGKVKYRVDGSCGHRNQIFKFIIYGGINYEQEIQIHSDDGFVSGACCRYVGGLQTQGSE